MIITASTTSTATTCAVCGNHFVLFDENGWVTTRREKGFICDKCKEKQEKRMEERKPIDIEI